MNNKIFYVFLISFLMLSLDAVTQSMYKLEGIIQIKHGKTYPYQIEFSIDGDLINGTSLTRLTDGTTPRTRITGTINKKLQTMSFSESSLAADKKDIINCFIEVILSYKPTSSKYMLRGDFKGKDAYNMFCGEGSIAFEDTKVISGFFGTQAGKDKQQTLQTDKQNTADTKQNNTQPAVKQGAKVNTVNSKVNPNKQKISPIKREPETLIDTSVINEQESGYEITAGVVKQFEWRSDTLVVDVYDGGVIDGDEVTLVLNDEEVLSRYSLTNVKRQLRLPLTKKVNTFSIIADREGKIPPNTADLILFDGHRRYKIKAYNNIGESAVIKIYTGK